MKTTQIFVNGSILRNNRENDKDVPAIMVKDKSPLDLPARGVHELHILDKMGNIVAKILNPVDKFSSESPCPTVSCWIETEFEIRILQQAARELLLAQSSDWSFILRAGTTTELAKKRITRHMERFWILVNSLEEGKDFQLSKLKEFEEEDSIFPLIQANDWYKT